VARGLSDQVDTNFTFYKFGAIFDNFRLWSRMSQECIDFSKTWIVLDQLHFIPYWAKKLGELWSTNQKVIDAHVEPPNWTFSRDYNSALRGCWPLKFSHTLQLPKMYFKSYLGRRAASCWALPHISSFLWNDPPVWRRDRRVLITVLISNAVARWKRCKILNFYEATATIPYSASPHPRST